MKKCELCLIILVLICLSLQGCFVAWDPVLRYSGENMDLATTAIYSIPGVESSLEDQFLIIEQDEYGRTLFLAYLPNGILIKDSFENGVLALVVMQSSDDAFVRFYEEQNYLPVITDSDILIDESTTERYFSAEAISELKSQNYWGCPEDTVSDKLVEIPIDVEKKWELTTDMDAALREEIGSNYRYQFLREDINGNKLVFGLSISKNTSKYGWFLVAFDCDGKLIEDSLQMINATDLQQISTVVQSTMDKIGWQSA